MIILDAFWFSGGGLIKVQDEHKNIKYYIRGMPMLGNMTPQQNAEYIVEWGTTFPKAAGDALFERNFWLG